jgi:uncharacterized protein YaeQ
MAQPSTLHRFRLDLSDVDRGIYQQLDFRLARHPSESLSYLLTRVIAYALNFEEGLEFSSEGLAAPELPSLSLTEIGTGRVLLWIEIGNPSPKKLHKASKSSNVVKVYTYKDPTLIQKECQSENIHRQEQIEIYGIDSKFLDFLSGQIGREVKLSLIHHDGNLTIDWGDNHAICDIKKYSL